jgi:sulfoxide reductase heme-binding subunit YedZ
LRFLIVALAITPLRRLGGPSLIRYRRAIGLLGFYYAVLHLTVYLVLDQGLDFAAIWADIVKRPYITVGMLALLCLVPLAITSTAGMVKRLGARRWRRLHRLVYVVGGLAALHFLWLAKVGRTDQYVYVAVLAVLLAVRVADGVRGAVRRRRAQRAAAVQASAVSPRW